MNDRKWHRWADVKNRVMSAEKQTEIRAKVLEDLRENELCELRRIAGMTQEDVASKSGFDQGELSRIERRDDHLLSTLRRYVNALGGDLEVVAVIGDHRVRLRSV